MTVTTLIAAARAEIGTPFRHQGRLPGKALDCAGLLVIAGRAAGYEINDVFGYGRLPESGLLEKALDDQQCLERVFGPPQAGDVLLMKFAGDPQHLALYAGETIIHAYADVKQVCEHLYDADWQAKTVRVYRFVGVKK